MIVRITSFRAICLSVADRSSIFISLMITIRPSSCLIDSNGSNFIIQFKWTVNLQQTKIIVDGSRVIVRMAMFGDALVLFNSFWKVDINASSDDISASNDTCTTMSSTQDPIFIQNGTSTSEIRFQNHKS